MASNREAEDRLQKEINASLDVMRAEMEAGPGGRSLDPNANARVDAAKRAAQMLEQERAKGLQAKIDAAKKPFEPGGSQYITLEGTRTPQAAAPTAGSFPTQAQLRASSPKSIVRDPRAAYQGNISRFQPLTELKKVYQDQFMRGVGMAPVSTPIQEDRLTRARPEDAIPQSNILEDRATRARLDDVIQEDRATRARPGDISALPGRDMSPPRPLDRETLLDRRPDVYDSFPPKPKEEEKDEDEPKPDEGNGEDSDGTAEGSIAQFDPSQFYYDPYYGVTTRQPPSPQPSIGFPPSWPWQPPMPYRPFPLIPRPGFPRGIRPPVEQ